MKLTTAKIKALNPCNDLLDNYLKYHESFSGTMTAFLDLPNITHRDKLWVYFRMIPKEYVSLVAADFAEHILHFYESRYPNDLRPRKAIEAA